jgi:SpoVK/Ycf46/Vps4 family AAA+-type ATPase
MELKAEDLSTFGLPVPRSALLFGPPGTSKSRLAKAIAEYLGWPLVVITPSEFLGKGLEQVHAQVNERFHDLLDLQRAVVFFDEMDALAQTREGDDSDGNSPKLGSRILQFVEQLQHGGRGGPLDVTRQLLTTSMLPKLSSLWDQKQVLFLMATNHKQQLDPAITRPSRFDLLLCVPPPSWTRKSSSESLVKILSIPQKSKLIKGEKISKEKAAEIGKELERLVPKGSDTEARLDVFTVAETGIFLDYLFRQTGQASLLEALRNLTDVSKFSKSVETWAKTSITLRTDSRILGEFQDDRKGSRRQYYPGQK